MRSWSAFISIPWRFCFLELVISHKLKWRFVLDVTAWTKGALSLYSPGVATWLRISVKRVEDATVCDARAMQPKDGRYCCQWVMSVQKILGVSASLTLGYSSYPLLHVEFDRCGRHRVVRECMWLLWTFLRFLGETTSPTLKFEWVPTADNRVIRDMENFQRSSESVMMNGRF